MCDDRCQCANRKKGGILGKYGGDELNNNGKLLLTFATDNKLAIRNAFSCTRKDGVSHTHIGARGSRASD